MARVFHQVFEAESCTYTYVVGDSASGKAALFDGVLECAPRDEALQRELGLRLAVALKTHCHADPVSSAAWFRERAGCMVMAHRNAGILPARPLDHGDVVRIGEAALRVLHTPGHTAGDISFAIEDRIFTGDTLLIGGCGRTDFQQGDASRLFDSIHGQLFTLPGATRVYPAHDYRGRTHSTIGEEKLTNPRLAGTGREQFVAVMNGLNLARPKQIDRGVPANTMAGAGTVPFTHVVSVPPERFFSIPGLVVVALDGPGALPDLPAPILARCRGGDDPARLDRLPKSRTIGLVGPCGTECTELEARLTAQGYDVVVLQGGLQAWEGIQAPAPQAGAQR